MDESQILEGLRNRNMQAFKMLYNSLSSFVVYYAERITSDKMEAEDITVKTFTRLWQQELSEYDSMAKVKNFIYNVARNAAIDYLRKKEVIHKYQSSGVNLEKQQEYIIERSRYEVELLRKVYEEIDKLPERTKKCFKMVYIQEMTSTQVGEQLKISGVTVRRLCAEALQKLRGKFSEKDLQLVLILLSLWELEKQIGPHAFS